MNRVIKFRAWIIKQKRMVYEDFAVNAVDGKMFGYLKSSISKEFRVFSVEYDIWKDNPPVIQQFTGICDKNGKEIFEGDILKYTNYSSKNYGHESIFEVKWSGTGFNCISLINENHSEVIGNIFENPELLNSL